MVMELMLLSRVNIYQAYAHIVDVDVDVDAHIVGNIFKSI